MEVDWRKTLVLVNPTVAARLVGEVFPALKAGCACSCKIHVGQPGAG
jgi:hypothetical protein